MNKVNNAGSVNFTSLRPKKLLGEAVLREFKNEMGYLKSSSYINYGIRKNRSGLSQQLYESLLQKEIKLNKEIYDSFLKVNSLDKKFDSFNEFNDQLVMNIKEKGNKANCWEDMMIIYTKLLNRGEIPYTFEMKTSEGNHFSTVFGLKKGADITKPSTWGTKALIVDAWFGTGIVKPAKEALKELELALCAGCKTSQKVSYESFPANFVLKENS